ncbi:hypothetical protein [uncultured Bradyrhizobium sp.]|uniref:hypothetical protein n=1 Tax=uncultured Bradyrhizobium sp. TaxID=199684 RepID=UPI0035C947FD
MDRWDGFGYVVFGTLLVLFLPFIAAVFGRGARWKALSLGLCIATLLLTGFDALMVSCWLGACVFAGLAIRERIKARAGRADAPP